MIHGRLTLIATRGLPGCGKTTYAQGEVADAPDGLLARCNRDDVRRMLHGTPRYNPLCEAIVTMAQYATIHALLQFNVSVIVDDTNLDPRSIQGLRKLAAATRADFTIVDLTHVPLDTCIDRDRRRIGDRRVGEEKIRQLHARHLDPATRTAAAATGDAR